jgi:hypothetical protein
MANFDNNKIYNKLKSEIEQIDIDFNEFCNILVQTKALLSGSSILSIITDNFKFNDFDIYITKDQYQIFNKFLRNKKSCTRCDTEISVQNKLKIKDLNKEEAVKYLNNELNIINDTDIIINQLSHDIAMYTRYNGDTEFFESEEDLIEYFTEHKVQQLSNINFVSTYKFKKREKNIYPSVGVIQVIVCDSPLGSIKDFDLSCVLNWFDGYIIHIGHLESIISKTSLPNNNRKSIKRKRLNKYIMRGYKILSIEKSNCGHTIKCNDKYFCTNKETYDVLNHPTKFEDLVDYETSHKIQIFSKPPIDLLNEITYMPPNNLLKEGGIEYQKNKLSFDSIKLQYLIS